MSFSAPAWGVCAFLAVTALTIGLCPATAQTAVTEQSTVASERLSGRVISSRDNKPVDGALVELRGTDFKMTTEESGVYTFTGIAPGAYILSVTPRSGRAVESRITVAAGEPTQLDVTVASAESAMEEIIVQAQRTPAATARRAQLEAPNLINIETYQEIRKLPDISTAEAVRRVPGISLETDEGEGRYVNIRGIDADLNSTTFGGLRLPPTNNASPFGGYRAVTLDSIPIGLVGAITVTKSNLPSQDAEALGGTIEITPKTAPPGGAPFVQGNIGSGYEPLRGTGIADVAVTAGGRFGGDGDYHPFSVVLTASYYVDSRGIDDVEPDGYFNDSVHPYQALSDLQQRDYELNRKRHGFGAEFGYQPDNANSYYLRAFEAGYTEYYERQFLDLAPDGNTVVAADGSLTDTLQGANAIQKDLRDEKETSIDRVIMAGGKNDFDDNVLDYRVGFTDGTYHKPYDYNSTFLYTPSSPNATINYKLNGLGQTPLYTISGATYLNPENFQLAGLSNSTADNYDRELSVVANLEHPVDWVEAIAGIDSDGESVKVGLSSRLRHKRETAQPYSYANLTSLPLTAASSGSNETYYAGQYQNGVDITPGYLQTVFGSGTIAVGDQTSALQQYLDAKENIFAGYAQYQGSFGRLGILGGVRVEQTRDRTNAFATGNDQNGNPFTSPVTSSDHYTNVFPSLQGKFEIEPDLIARATWSSTIGRPGFNQLTPALNIDLGSGFASTGNPNLKPETSDSFDVTLEKYLPEAGILSVGFFDKEITNYIIPSISTQTLPNNALFPGSALPLRVVTYSNASSGSFSRGFEFNWEQHFRWLPGIWGGLGAGANYTYVDSSVEIRPGETSSLPSSSKHTWNISLFYEKDGLALKIAAYSVSKDLFAIGGDRTTDIFNAKRTSMDFGGSYALNQNWAIYFNAKNLLDTPHAFYQATTNRPIQREFYGQTYQIGARFDY